MYHPQMISATVVSNRALSETLFLISLKTKFDLSEFKSGQFIHLRIPGMEAHVLRRPFSVYAIDCKTGCLEVLYQLVGFGSQCLSTLSKDTSVDLIGPLGNGWSIPNQVSKALLVGGGVGSAPLYMHARELLDRGIELSVVLGAQSKDQLVTLADYTDLLGSEPFCSTDDGSYGYHGFCTDVVSGLVSDQSFDYVACCGPEPMMKFVSKLTLAAGIPTYISLEKRMACGIGACLSCVVNTKKGYLRSCVDGPIFNASEVIW